MSRDTNVFVATGRLVKKAELRYTPNGKAVTNFTIANNQGEYNGQKDVDYIDCVVWGKTAENLVKYTDKGRKILVEGKLKTRMYEDQTGGKRKITEVLVSSIEYLGAPANSSGQTNSNPPAQNENEPANYPSDFDAPGGGIPLDISDDDLPF